MEKKYTHIEQKVAILRTNWGVLILINLGFLLCVSPRANRFTPSQRT